MLSDNFVLVKIASIHDNDNNNCRVEIITVAAVLKLPTINTRYTKLNNSNNCGAIHFMTFGLIILW